MKKYSIPFFANKKQCQKAIKVNELIKSVYHGIPDDALAELLASTFNAFASFLSIDGGGIHCGWHLKFADNLQHNVCTPNYVNLDMMTADTKKIFIPEVKEFSAPAIGEEFFVWKDGEIKKMFVDCYTIESHITGWESYHITFHGENPKDRVGHITDSEHKMNQWIANYCRKSIDEFDSKFWSKEFKKMVQEKDQELKELQKEYNSYKSYY